MRTCHRAAVWAVLAGLWPAMAGAALTHRYSFDDGTADDSVGNVNGTLMNGATVSDGQLQFDPSINNGSNNPITGQYVSLPANIIATPAFSIEVWATERSSTPWQRLLDMSDGPNGQQLGTGTGFMLMTPFGYPGEGLFGQVTLDQTSGSNTNYVTTSTEAPLNVENQYVYTFSPATGREFVYEDGLQVGEAVANLDPSTAAYTQFWIGRSNFTADPYFDGSIDEFRTYDTAITGAQVLQDYVAGPEQIPEPTSLALMGLAATAITARRRPR